MKPSHPPGRVLPPVFKKAVELSFQRRLTFKERLQILIGYNLLVTLVMGAEHHPGRIDPHLVITTTEMLSPVDRLPWWRRMFKGFRA